MGPTLATSASVLYVTGARRSGTTLLGEIMNAVPGVVFCGEVRRIWTKGLDENRLCSCGDRILDCPCWASVIEEAFGGVKPARKLREGIMAGRPTPRHLPRMLAFSGEKALARIPKVRRDALQDLYDAIATVTGAKLIVDTGKIPMYGYQLDLLEGLDTTVVHQVRDPRGVAYSSTKEKAHPDPDEELYLTQFTPRETAQEWMTRNFAADALWRSADNAVRIRYEDLASSPRPTIGRILDTAGQNGLDEAFLDDETVTFRGSHALWGNPLRMDEGDVKIRLDTTWRRKLPIRDQRLVTALTLPGLLRYGYPVRP